MIYPDPATFPCGCARSPENTYTRPQRRHTFCKACAIAATLRRKRNRALARERAATALAAAPCPIIAFVCYQCGQPSSGSGTVGVKTGPITVEQRRVCDACHGAKRAREVAWKAAGGTWPGFVGTQSAAEDDVEEEVG